MRKIIENKKMDAERSLYNIVDTDVKNIIFAGEQDGESVLKETRGCKIINCQFSLRYPLWHALDFVMNDSTMDLFTRAPIWYSKNGVINDSTINGIKAVRECQNIKIDNCQIISPEFGWKTHKIEINNSTIDSEYLLFDSSDISLDNVKLKGKYSFQYNHNLHVKNSILDTKDAFWHVENAIIENSEIIGEYLGWYSHNLTLINCHIVGTQPLCYCTDLKLINCTMDKTDLSFENSSVEADVVGNIESIKNPLSGKILCDSVGEIINDSSVYDCKGQVIIRHK